jgi:hypothetical protein
MRLMLRAHLPEELHHLGQITPGCTGALKWMGRRTIGPDVGSDVLSSDAHFSRRVDDLKSRGLPDRVRTSLDSWQMTARRVLRTHRVELPQQFWDWVVEYSLQRYGEQAHTVRRWEMRLPQSLWQKVDQTCADKKVHSRHFISRAIERICINLAPAAFLAMNPEVQDFTQELDRCVEQSRQRQRESELHDDGDLEEQLASTITSVLRYPDSQVVYECLKEIDCFTIEWLRESPLGLEVPDTPLGQRKAAVAEWRHWLTKREAAWCLACCLPDLEAGEDRTPVVLKLWTRRRKQPPKSYYQKLALDEERLEALKIERAKFEKIVRPSR